MRNFPIDCEVIFTRPDDKYKGQIGKVVSERSPTGRYSIDVGNTRVFRHENDICEASEFMKEKAMQNETKLIPEPDLSDVAKGIWVCIDKGYDFENTKEYFYGQKVDEELLINLYDECKNEGISAFAKKYMSGKTMQNELVETPKKQLTPTIDLEQLVVNTNAIIKIDVDLSIQYIDARVASFSGESEELEAELKKWYKDFTARRLDLTRPVNESLKQVIADEKKIGDYLDKIFAENKAKRDAAEAERKKAKYAEVMTTMADMLNSVDLPSEYLAKVVFREEYYNKTMVNKKLADSIQGQIDDQVKLYNGWKAEQELKQQKIKNRELLLQNLNQQYGFNGVYSQFTIEMCSDEQVKQAYKSKKEKQDAEEAKRQTEQAQASSETHNVHVQNKNSQEMAKSSSQSHSSLQTHTQNGNEIYSQESSQRQDTVAEKNEEEDTKLSEKSVTKTFNITIDAGSAERSAGAMATVEKRLAEMRDNFATKYGVKMEICQQ